MIKQFLQDLEGKYKVATISVFVILILTLIGLIVSSTTQFIILIFALISITFVTVLVVLNKTKNSIRYFSLFILFTTAISLLPPIANPLMGLINTFLKSYFPSHRTLQTVGEISSMVHLGTLIILLIGVFIVNYFMSKEDLTAMKIHPKISNLSKILDMDLIVKMVNISKAFGDDIERLDRQLDWSSKYFTPLDAEVLIKTEKDDKRKILDLLTAIKSSKDRLFLLLGEPGSGKSVALRKLAKELSSETVKTGKIPIYINLKEWSFEKEKTLTVEDLNFFIVSYLKRSDPIIKKFFFRELDDKETVFDKLHEYGHIYYLFDSFDEIPQVINSKENTKLIANISEVLNIFLTGARTRESQGIVASRLYKKPSREFLARTVLEIRPFNESKIIKTLENIGYRRDDLIKKLFTTRPDLVQIAKNPFSAMLIAKYAEKHQHQLPKNQSELFSVFIENSLYDIEDELVERGVTIENIIECSIKISNIMFSSDGGLETSIEVLQDKLPEYDIKNIIYLLKEAGLGRGHIKDDNIFSFSHRRIAEYFYVHTLLEDNNRLDLESIPSIGEQRDALVLYCEVAEIEQAKEIANYCWSNIKESESILNTRSVNSLRFLVESFRNRLSALEDFKDELAEFVLETIKSEKHILILKLSIEVLGLLDEDKIDIGVSRIFELNNFWLSETAILACRHLDKISDKLKKNIKDYINDMGYDIFFPNFSSMVFSFSLSDSFIKFKRLSYLKIIDLIVFIPGLILVIYIDILWKNYTSVVFVIIITLVYIISNRTINGVKYFAQIVLILFAVHIIASTHYDTEHFLRLFGLFLMSIPFLKIISFDIDFLKNEYMENGLIILIIIGGVLYHTLNKDYTEKTNLIYIFLILIILVSFYYFYYIVKDMRVYEKINFKQLNYRPYIYTCFVNLNSFYYRMKLIKYLEDNIEEVSGEWQNSDIMKINDKALIRLAKLEEKWLKLDR